VVNNGPWFFVLGGKMHLFAKIKCVLYYLLVVAHSRVAYIKGNKITHISRACWYLMVEFAAVCLVFRQGRACEVWLFPINRR